MIPYNIDYCEEKIKEYKEKIKESKKGNFTIKYSEGKEFDGYLYEHKQILKESPIELYEGENFDFFYVDIYEYKLTTKVVEDYVKLTKLHDIVEYSFFGVESFILSCPTSEIIWVYILEEWMDMSKDLFTRFNHSEYIEYFSPMEENKVLEVLKEFGKVL